MGKLEHKEINQKIFFLDKKWQNIYKLENQPGKTIIKFSLKRKRKD